MNTESELFVQAYNKIAEFPTGYLKVTYKGTQFDFQMDKADVIFVMPNGTVRAIREDYKASEQDKLTPFVDQEGNSIPWHTLNSIGAGTVLYIPYAKAMVTYHERTRQVKIDLVVGDRNHLFLEEPEWVSMQKNIG